MAMDLETVKGGIIWAVLSSKDDPDLMTQWLDKALPIISTDVIIRGQLWAKIDAVMASRQLLELKIFVDAMQKSPTRI